MVWTATYSTPLFIIQIVSLLIIALIVWLAIKAFKRYKEQVVDPEKEHLVKQNEKLRHVNRRLTDSNLDLAKKLEALRSQLPDANI